jgi:hypothetical protein
MASGSSRIKKAPRLRYCRDTTSTAPPHLQILLARSVSFEIEP